jgi:predicted transcriptional regulator
MSAAKERVSEVIQTQPENALFEEIMRELCFERMVARGLEDASVGRVVSNEEVRRRIDEWRR